MNTCKFIVNSRVGKVCQNTVETLINETRASTVASLSAVKNLESRVVICIFVEPQLVCRM